MPVSPLEYVRHMRREAQYLCDHTVGLRKEEFLHDETRKRAFVRSLEIMGEAAKMVPEELRRKYSAIPWRAMAAMRDRLIHAYFGVDYDLVWDAVINKAPPVLGELERILRQEKEA